MATVTAFMPLSIPNLEIWDGDILSATSTQIVESDGFRQAIYTGSFTYDAFGNPFGTLTRFEELRGGNPFYTVTGLSADANEIYVAVETQSDPEAVAALLLANDDVVNGSSGNDHLLGFAGNDSMNGGGGNNTLDGGTGDDTLTSGSGTNVLFGGEGNDTAVLPFAYTSVEQFIPGNGGFLLISGNDAVNFFDVETIVFTDQTRTLANLIPVDPISLTGTDASEVLNGDAGDDTLIGGGGDDTLNGGDGRDNLQGGEGNDEIIGGTSENDLRDLIFGGAGNDNIDGGYGNDELRGDAGNDSIAGGFGVDTVIGGTGDDVMTGSAFSDLIFGGDGNDFVNGGFGSDRVNGGDGADRFFHVGVTGHGSDWIQDFDHAEGDVMVYGGSATIDQFQVNVANTANAGDAGIDEAFVIYRPTGQILWALVDGMQNDELTIRINGADFDLLA